MPPLLTSNMQLLWGNDTNAQHLSMKHKIFSPLLIYQANRLSGFYMMRTLVMNVLKCFMNLQQEH